MVTLVTGIMKSSLSDAKGVEMLLRHTADEDDSLPSSLSGTESRVGEGGSSC